MTAHDSLLTHLIISKKHQPQDSQSENQPENQHASLSGKIKKTPGRKKGSTKKLKNNLTPTPFDFEEFCTIGEKLKFQPESTAISAPLSPDISYGALLMSHLRNHCESCWTIETPQWRKGWYSDILGRVVLLCNACGLKYHKKQFCSYCKFVYGKEVDRSSKKFVHCTSCEKCVHVECEKRYGNWNVWAPKYTEATIRREFVCLECSQTNQSTLKSLLLAPAPSALPTEESPDHGPALAVPKYEIPPVVLAKKPHHPEDEPDYSSATSPIHISHHFDHHHPHHDHVKVEAPAHPSEKLQSLF